MIRRILGVAGVRLRESTRGPLVFLLLLFLAGAAAATFLTPGEPGAERQRAVDGFVLDAALFATVLGAAAFGSASLAGDREGGREALLRTTPLRPAELLAGGFLGHAAGLGILVLGAFLGTLSVTGLLSGGNRDRTPTREPLLAERLLDHRGRDAGEGQVLLTADAPEATFVLAAPRASLPPVGELAEPRAWVRLRELVDEVAEGLTEEYPVGVRIGEGADRVIRVRSGADLVFPVPREEVRPEGDTPIRIRRIDPAFTLGISRASLVVEGRRRPFAGNLLKTLLAWFLALLVVAAAAQALSAVVGAPVGAAGALLLTLLGRSVGPVEAAARSAAASDAWLSEIGGRIAQAAAVVCPDFRSYDLTSYATMRWDVPPALVAGILPRAALAACGFLAAAWVLVRVRRRA